MALVVKNSPADAGDLRDVDLISGLGRFPWRKKWQHIPVFLPGKSMDRGAWWATVLGVAKGPTQLSD